MFLDSKNEAKQHNASDSATTPEPAPESATTSEPTPESVTTSEPATQSIHQATTVTPEEQLEEEDLEAQLAYQRLKRSREARKRKRKITIAIVGVFVLLVIIWFVAGAANNAAEGGGKDAAPITATVRHGDLESVVSANGATEPLASTVVSPEVDGIIENVSVEEGSHVEEGDVLFTIKNDDLDKAVNEAERALESAQRAETLADQSIDDANAAYQRAWNEGNNSGDWSTFDENTLKSAIKTAESAYEDARSSVESAQSKLDDARAQADKRTVRAPVSGSVVAMNAVNGAAVGSATSASSASNTRSNEPLVQIADLGQMKVTVQVNELDISSITAGQTATATFSAIPGLELDATVQRIASTSTGSSEGGSGGAGGVVTYAVDLVIPNPDTRLKPGMTATVKIVTQNVPNTLIVPVAAIVGEGDDAYVSVVEGEDGTEITQKHVEVVDKNATDAAVRGDLKEGDSVLLETGDLGSSSGSDDGAMISAGA